MVIFNLIILRCLLGILAVIILDFIMGVLLSIKAGTFDPSKLPQFLATNVLPYIGGLIVVALFANYIPELMEFFYFVVGLAAVKFSKEALYEKTSELYALYNSLDKYKHTYP